MKCTIFLIFVAGVTESVTVSSVAVAGCTAAPCMLKKGTNATVTITYKLSKYLISYQTIRRSELMS